MSFLVIKPDALYSIGLTKIDSARRPDEESTPCTARQDNKAGRFCVSPNLKGKHIYVLHAFVKKSEKTPKKELDLARQRQKEVQKI